MPIPDALRNLAARQEPRVCLPVMRVALEGFMHSVPAAYRGTVEGALAGLAALPGFDSVPRTLIHTDLAWGNVMADASGRLVLVDFEGAGVGPPVVDLVEITTYLTDTGSGAAELDEAGARSFFAGYAQERRLTPEELDAFPAAHRYHQLWCLALHLKDGQFPDAARKLTRIVAWEKACVYERLRAIAVGQ